MGVGDEVIATGLARGLRRNGKRAAFGDGKQIIWGPWCKSVFWGNANIASPGSERSSDLQWIKHYKGSRLYNHIDRARSRWVWNYDFKVIPGEIFFKDNELSLGDVAGQNFIYVEPNVPWHKSVAPNKDWGAKNYQAVIDLLRKDGHDIVQSNREIKLQGTRLISTPTYRDALAVLARARVALVPEGGMHHGAAAFGIPAVVLFGGFIPPAVMGYPGHINLTGGAEACGSFIRCRHCLDAMSRITVEEVYAAVKSLI